MPSHKRFRRKLDSERVHRELKVMVEKVSDGVSQVGVWKKSSFGILCQIEMQMSNPNILCRLESNP